MAANLFMTATIAGGPAMADCPTRTVTLIAPYAAGGSTDILARLVAEGMQEKLDNRVIVENRGGAGSRLARNMWPRQSLTDTLC